MTASKSIVDIYNKRLSACHTAYLCKAMSYDEYIITLEQIHDLMVGSYYAGEELLADLIYQTEEKINAGVH